jgi:hypothetical protein
MIDKKVDRAVDEILNEQGEGWDNNDADVVSVDAYTVMEIRGELLEIRLMRMSNGKYRISAAGPYPNNSVSGFSISLDDLLEGAATLKEWYDEAMKIIQISKEHGIV